MPSADPKLDAMESSVVGEKGGDHAEKKCANEDNINGAGKGGVVDKGGNGVNVDANPQIIKVMVMESKPQKDEDTEKYVSAD
jgi:hypothetical protein